MIKTFVLIVALAGLNPVTGGKDLMLFPQKFETVESCIEFARMNKEPLFQRTWEFYGVRPVENIYCVSEEQLKTMNIRPQTKEDITPPTTTPTPKQEPEQENNTLDWDDWNKQSRLDI